MNNQYIKKSPSQSGFTLIEIMISLLVFATGMLGVTYQMSQGIKNIINTEVHSSTMQVALQSIEPLRRSVMQGKDEFLVQLKELRDNGGTPPFAGNSNQANFKILVEKAVDIDSKNLFDNDFSTTDWKAPFTVVLKIIYDTEVDYGGESTELTYYTTHVLVPSV